MVYGLWFLGQEAWAALKVNIYLEHSVLKVN